MVKWKARETLLLAIIVLGLSAVFSVCFYYIAQVPEDVWKDLGYVGISALSFAGASSLIIPIPYTIALLAIAPAFNPLLFAVAVGLGSAAGELTGYGIGYVGGWVIGKKRRRQSDAMLRIFNRFGAPVIFLFALTPLPDDLLFIPLGLMRYSLWKAFAVCVAGKFCMALLIAYSGLVTEGLFIADWLFAVITTVLLAVLVVAMFRINWVKLAGRYAPKRT